MRSTRKQKPWITCILLLLLSLSVQGCLGLGSSTPPNSTTITQHGNGGQQVTVAQNLFKGKIYLTIDHNLWVTTGDNKSTELLNTGNIYDPAVSPDGKWVAFTIRFKNYSQIAYMSTQGGPVKIILDGNGEYYLNQGGNNNYYWYVEPSWSPDGTHILFLSDLQKNLVWANLNPLFRNSYFLDLQVFSIPFNNPSATPQALAYASFGDGGDRDAAFQPGNAGARQIIYTHYAYDTATGTQQVIEIYMADANAIANHPGMYSPVYDSGVALTPPTTQNIQPAFSPDGDFIAYIRRESPSSMGLYVMSTPVGVTADPNNQNSQVQALIPYKTSSHLWSSQYVSQPLWSPDGKQIAFLEYTNSEFDLWLANVSFDAKTKQFKLLGSPMQITTGGVDGESRPVWTA